MSVLVETSVGNLVLDLYTDACPKTSLNFIKLCKIKYYNFCLFHFIERGFLAQTGDPTGTGKGGSSVYGLLQGPSHRCFKHELHPHLKHTRRGLLCMAPCSNELNSSSNNGSHSSEQQQLVNASQFFITFSSDPLPYLDGRHTIFGEVGEGFDVLDRLEQAFVDERGRPLQDIRIKHTIILHDPFEDPRGLEIPDRSPEPSKDVLDSDRLAADEDVLAEVNGRIDVQDEKEREAFEKQQRQREAQSRALTLEMLGDLPYADIKPPENVLFVCKLNPVTQEEDLDLIFSRFGKIER